MTPRASIADSVRALCHAIAIVLWLLPQGVGAADPVTISLTPALQGRYLDGSSAELGVRLLTATSGAFELALSSPRGTTRYRGVLQRNQPLQLWLPVRPSSGGHVDLLLSGEGRVTQSRQIRFDPQPEPTRFQLIDPTLPGSGSDRVLDSSELPRHAAGYPAIDGLTLPAPLLNRLDRAQSEALNHYLAGCGRLWVTGASAELLQPLRKLAGCGGRAINPPSDRPAAPVALPTPEQLAELLNGGADPRRTLALWFALYAFGLLLVLRKGSHRWGVALPLAASVALPLLWPLLPERPQRIHWTSIDSGDWQGPSATLLQLTATQAERRPLPLQAAPFSGSGELLLAAGQPPQLLLQTTPLSRHRVYQRSAGAAPFQVTLVIDQSRPRVTNRGESPLPGGLLNWQTRLYRVPAIAAGASWQPAAGERSLENDTSSLLLKRFSSDAAAVLLLSDERNLTSEWLLVRSRGRSA